MAASASKQLHAVAIPLPGQGHINPLMRFCRRLASQEGFTITFVDIHVIAPSIITEPNKQLEEEHGSTHAITDADGKQKHKSIHGKQEHTNILDASKASTRPDKAAVMHKKLDIRRVSLTMEMLEPGNGITLLETFFKSLESLPPLLEELLCRLIHEDPPITCLISEFYMGFTQNIADKFCIPRVDFHTSSQRVLVVKNYILEGTISLDQVLKVVTSKDASKEDIFVEGLLGLPSLRNGDLMDFHEDNVFFYTLNLQRLKETKERAHAIVVNTSKDLEELGLKVDNIGGVPIYAVGPLTEPLDKDTSTSLWKEDNDCLLWLSEQPCRSVLYISFGSFATLSKAQFEEIVAGLIASQQRFLWVFRANLVNDASDSTLHSHLLSQSHGKGYLIEWAPQVRVLSHPSVGGFLTHCGWNSTIEAITLGVPMLCFPHIFDQFMNARFITEEWKVGLGFKMSKESGLVKREEVERVIRALMVGEEGKVLHRNAEYFKEVTHQNLELESTSSKNIQALVDSLPEGIVS